MIKKYIYIYFFFPRKGNLSRGGHMGSCPSNLSNPPVHVPAEWFDVCEGNPKGCNIDDCFNQHFKCIILTICCNWRKHLILRYWNKCCDGTKPIIVYCVFECRYSIKLNILRPGFNLTLQQNNWPGSNFHGGRKFMKMHHSRREQRRAVIPKEASHKT